MFYPAAERGGAPATRKKAVGSPGAFLSSGQNRGCRTQSPGRRRGSLPLPGREKARPESQNSSAKWIAELFLYGLFIFRSTFYT